MYNFVYFDSFLNAIKELNGKDKKLEGKWQQQQGENILLKTWFLNMDKEFDEKLRSKRFISLLDTFINSNLNIFNNINYTDGYLNSQLIYHNFFDLYLKYFYSPFISYTKEFNLAEYEIIFQKDNVKLLHYINKYQKCTETRGSKKTYYLLFMHQLIVFIF